MRISTRIVVSIETGCVISRESFEYHGPVAEAISGGGSKNKSKQQSQSESESGTAFNEDFLNKAFMYAGMAAPGKYKIGGPTAAGPAQFDEEAYLRANPDVKNFKDGAYEHYLRYGKAEGRDPGGTGSGVPSFAGDQTEFEIPGYDPTYVRGNFTGSQYTPGAFTGAQYTGSNYTGANYTPVEGGDINKIEQNIYGGQAAKLRQAYDQQAARQREELSQSGALNSPTQYLEGSARSSLDRGFLEQLQAAARDSSTMALNLKAQEAARRTGYDVGEAGRRTGYDVGEATRRTGFDASEALRRTGFDVGEAGARTGFGERQAGRLTEYDTAEAGRETAFNQDVQLRLLDLWLKKMGIIVDSGRFARGEQSSSGQSSGSSANFGIASGGGGGTTGYGF